MFLNFKNNASTTLSNGINDTQQTIVISEDVFPDPPFAITVYESTDPSTGEIMYCVGKAGTTLTVIRGREGTSPQSFNSGATVSMLITKGSLNSVQSINGAIDWLVGDKDFSDDFEDSTLDSSWSIVNPGLLSYTLYSDKSTIKLEALFSSSDDCSPLVRSLPSTGDWDIITKILGLTCKFSNYAGLGLGVWDSNSQKHIVILLSYADGLKVEVPRWNDHNSWNSTPYTSSKDWTVSFPIYLKVRVDRTNSVLKFYLSNNPYSFYEELYSESFSTFIGNPSKFGFRAHTIINSGQNTIGFIDFIKCVSLG